MRFDISICVFNADSDEVLCLIDNIIDRVAENVHQVDTDASALESSTWYRTARRSRRRLLTTSLSSPPVQRRTASLHKVYHVRDERECAVAAKLAYTPLTIIVEDREADGLLLDVVVAELAPASFRAVWSASSSPPAVSVQSAGGLGNIPTRVQRALDEAARENRPLRLFVLCDSDARWPGDTDHSSKKGVDQVTTSCDSHQIPHHVLEKRYAENYIPDGVFEDMIEDPHYLAARERLRAFLQLNRKQRDHFPIKDGLSPTERDQAIAANLYDESHRDTLSRLLEERLLPKRPRPLVRLTEERRALFTREGLRERDGADELSRLIEAIAQEL